MTIAHLFVEDSILNLGAFFSSDAAVFNTSFTRTISTSKWIKARDSTLLLSNLSVTDLRCTVDPGLISAEGGRAVWSGGTLRHVWAKEQTLVYADGANMRFEHISLSGFNGTFIHIRRGNVEISDSDFDNRETQFQSSELKLYGSLVHCASCTGVDIRRTRVKHLSARIGGAVYVAVHSVSKFAVSDSDFENCEAGEKGGAIYSEQASIELSGNRFISNRAVDGGAVYVTCDPTLFACQTNIRQTIFEFNEAESGGGIRWKETRPVFTSVQYFNNSAVYGPDEASQASHLGLIDAFTLQPIETLQYLGVPGQRVPVPLLIGLIDTVGQLVATDNSSYVNIQENALATFQGSTRLLAVNGIANYSAFIIKASPGSTLSLEAVSDEISTSPSNYERTNVLQFEYQMRNCEAGEHDESTTCYPCPKTSYSLYPQQECTACPSTATCPGGAILDLDPGYWRSSNTSDRIEKCFLEEACEGGDDSECAEGYTSNMCGMCAHGWYRVAKVTCFKCGSVAALTARIFVVGVLYLGFIGFVIYFILSRLRTCSTSKGKELSSLLKIVVKYFQLMMLISGLKTEWSESVLRMFELMEFFGSIIIGSFSPECYLSQISDTPVIYLKLIIVSIGLLSLIAVVELICLFLRLVHVRVANSYLTAVEMVFLLFLQPVQVKYAMNMLECKNLDTGAWLIAHMSEKCWQGNHRFYLLTLALPSLILFGFGTLVLLAAFLFLQKLNSEITTGYLISGFSTSSRYWELVHQTEKLSLAVAVGVLGPAESKVQILVVSIIVFSSLYAQKMHNPFLSAQANSANLYSISSVCVYITLAFYNHYFGDSAATIREVLSIVSFGSLCLFLLRWCRAMVKTVRNRPVQPAASLELPDSFLQVPNNSSLSISNLASQKLKS